MIISCNTIVDRRDHVQYLTVSKSYSDDMVKTLDKEAFEQSGRPHIPNSTYQVPRSSAFWFWRRRLLKGFYRI